MRGKAVGYVKDAGTTLETCCWPPWGQ